MNPPKQPSHRRTLVLHAWLVFIFPLLRGSAFSQAPKEFEAAAAAFAAGNLSETERLVRAGLSRHPGDVFGLNLLAVALDGERKYAEAEEVYARALRQGRNSTLLNNLANHYLAEGKKDKAKKYFRETLRFDPHHANALYQLSKLQLDDRQPAAAEASLAALPEADREKPAVVLLRAQADFENRHPDVARQTLAPLEALKEGDVSVAFSLGVLYYKEQAFPEAVLAFEAAVRQSPGDFDILYNLGLAYYQGGQRERAAEVLERAVRVKPESVDAIYRLACVLGELGRDEAAVELLIRARQSAPQRADLGLLLARECAKQEFWLDAADAYESYLRLKPDDAMARKELAIAYGHLRNFEQALSQMDRYVAARRQDAEGYYLRGLIAWHMKRSSAAAADFERALALDPKRAEPWSRLGEIARQKNELEEAERCYRRALQVEPAEPNALYGLGQVLNARGQYRQAVPYLEEAIRARAQEPAPYYQLAIAYRRLGQSQQASAEMERFQELRKSAEHARYVRTGLVAYVSEGMKLTESERQARELEYLGRASAIKPGDPMIMERLVNACLAAGKKAQADEAIQQWLARDPSGWAALRVGVALAQHGDERRAIPYFRQAAQHPEHYPASQMGLADGEFHLGDYPAALGVLDAISPMSRPTDYYLLRATILDKLKRYQEALAAYQQAVRADPRQENAYLEMGVFFAQHQAYDAALEDFRAAQKTLPQSLKLALAEAIVLNLAGRRQESYGKLRAIEGRWPEQDWPYILAGISAYTAYRYEDSRKEFEKAAALESSNPLTYYYLALLDSDLPQSDPKGTLRWAEMAVEGDPAFAQAHLLLGKLYVRQGQNQEARKSLEQAVRLQPNLADAHYLLGRIYAGLGDATRAQAEVRESERWHREVHQVSPEKENIQRLLVDIGPSRR